ESEFFGHERGAFTGAAAQRRGRFEQADGGTLFLDEIGDMPADLQTRLLRVLQDGTFYRVGGHSLVKVDVRIIAATNQNLEKAVADGRFREDLFHRLNVIRVRIPSLRERREDIGLLLRHFLVRSAQELQVEPKRLTPEVSDTLQNLVWPGNVRQLENVCRWITVMAPAQEIHLQDLPTDLHKAEARASASLGAPAAGEAQEWPAVLRQWAEQHLAAAGDDLVGIATPALERTLIEAALKQTHGHRQEAAKLLGWGRNTLTRKLKELGMGNGDED
ncbi:MAG: sigma 54-interacting transcriptional regulator, partial [Nevskiales bacterium]